MRDLLVKDIREESEGNWFNVRKGSEEMLCWVEGFCECVEVF